jgi:hypothetical protein
VAAMLSSYVTLLLNILLVIVHHRWQHSLIQLSLTIETVKSNFEVVKGKMNYCHQEDCASTEREIGIDKRSGHVKGKREIKLGKGIK